MKTNLGYLDRSIRVLVGLFVMVVGYQLESEWGVIGIYPVLTALLGVCPLYHWLHWSTYHHPGNGEPDPTA
jgi:hypothetical protein